MDTLNILVIEDMVSDSEPLIKVLKENNYTVVGVATNYSEALKLFYEKKIDLVIIDIFLNGKPDGITFAETINITPNVSKPFVFLTASKDRHIFESAKITNPYSFLMKPFNELEVLYAIEMAVEKFYAQKKVFSSEEQNTVVGTEYLFIKKKKSLKKVSISDILYIEVEGRYCNIVTQNEKFIILISLLKINELLKNFIKTHRNYLVNTDKIIEIIMDENLIILSGNHKIILSEKYKSFISQLNILK